MPRREQRPILKKRSLRRLAYLILAPAEPNNEAEHRHVIWLSRERWMVF